LVAQDIMLPRSKEAGPDPQCVILWFTLKSKFKYCNTQHSTFNALLACNGNKNENIADFGLAQLQKLKYNNNFEIENKTKICLLQMHQNVNISIDININDIEMNFINGI
jgi:hypothetical protein